MMRTIGACIAIAALGAVVLSPSPGAAFGLSLGPFHLGLPLPGPFIGFHHRHPMAPARAAKPEALHDEADLKAVESTPDLTPALLYPVLASPTVFDDIFWPASSPQWPFSYDAILRTAFAKPQPDRDLHPCQQADRTSVIVERLKHEIRPSGAELQQLRKLGGALGMASGYLAKTCPNEIPAQPVARLQLMEWQIEKLAQALDIVRLPLQDLEQVLNKNQRARFVSAVSRSAASRHVDSPESVATTGAATPTAIDWSIEQISLSVDPTDAQRQAMAALKQSFATAASELDAYYPTSLPASPLARLEATEARLDATWRAVVAIQVALASFEKELNDRQRIRFDATDLAKAQ